MRILLAGQSHIGLRAECHPDGLGIQAGTGLGLAVTLDVIKNHEGTIEVESTPGKGTTMIVNLPLASGRS